MSASIATLASAASSLLQLFGGSGGVILGDVTFAGTEVPATIKWGGKQSAPKQILPGGAVVMYPMGIDYSPLTWTGYFQGYNALVRSRALYTMMADAKIVNLSWNDRSFQVLVTSYEASDEKPNWIPYSITCTVSSDATLSSKPPAPSLLSRITGGLENALGITPSDLAGVAAGLSTAQQLAGVAGALTDGSSAALALQGSLASVGSIAQGATALANGSMAGVISAAADVIPAGNASQAVESVATAVGAASDLAALPIVSGAIGTAAKIMGSL